MLGVIIGIVAVIDVVVIYACCKSAGLREQAAEKTYSDLKQNKDRK